MWDDPYIIQGIPISYYKGLSKIFQSLSKKQKWNAYRISYYTGLSKMFQSLSKKQKWNTYRII